MEWEESEMSSDNENERRQSEGPPELQLDGPGAAKAGAIPTPVTRISDEESDTTESSSEDEDDDKLTLIATHTQYHMPTGDNEMESDSEDTQEPGSSHIKRGFQSDCAFCQCSLMGFMESSPELNEEASPPEGNMVAPPVEENVEAPPTEQNVMEPLPPLSPYSSHSGDDELDDYLDDYYEDMDLEEENDFSLLENVNISILIPRKFLVPNGPRSLPLPKSFAQPRKQ